MTAVFVRAPPRRAWRWLTNGRCIALAVALYLGELLVMATRIVRHSRYLDSWWVYAVAAESWSSRGPLYKKGVDGFQYLPQAAILFAPFARLGSPAGDITWRAVSWVVLALAVWRVSATLAPNHRGRTFLLVAALSVGPSVASLVNGQANQIIAALMLHAAVDLAYGHRWRASAWLSLGLALKPIMIVMMLLACVLDRPLIARVVVGVALLALLPFVLAPAPYVVTQLAGWWDKLGASSRPDRYFEDLRGLVVHATGWPMPHALLAVVRLLGAVGASVLTWELRRHWRAPDRTLMLCAVAATYLMLLNPRTQASSYVLVAPIAAVASARLLLRGRRRAGSLLAVLCLSWMVHVHFAKEWLKPLTCLVFAVLVAREIYSRVGFPQPSERLPDEARPHASTPDPCARTTDASGHAPSRGCPP